MGGVLLLFLITAHHPTFSYSIAKEHFKKFKYIFIVIIFTANISLVWFIKTTHVTVLEFFFLVIVL